MGKFRMPSAEEYREFIRTTPAIPEEEKQRLFAVLDYAAEHPSTLEEKIEQARRAEKERLRLANKTP